MKRKLVRKGNGWAIYIPTQIIKLLKYDIKNTKVVYEIDNDVLKITEAKDDRGLSKKLNRHGSGWALFVSNTILELLEIEPEIDMIKYQIENNILKITKA